MEYIDLIQTLILGATVVGLIVTIIEMTLETRRLRLAIQSDTTQKMVYMMNDLRNKRLDNPALEKILFAKRKNWSDDEIRRHVFIVELVNIFEWSYLARRDGLIDKETWSQWIKTWRDFIVADDRMKEAFEPSVFTFSHEEARDAITKLIKEEQVSAIDPYKSWLDP